MKKIPLLVMFCSLLIIGCTEKDGVDISSENNQISLVIAEPEKISVYSTATTRENMIEDCFVIVFDNSGVFKACEKVDVSKIARNGSETQLLPQLDTEIITSDKVFVICNTGLTAVPSGIITENDLNDKFKPAKDYYLGGDALPMSGSFIWAPQSATAVMIRTVAKVQIKLGESFNIGGLENVPEWYNFAVNYDESKSGFIIGNYGGKSNIIASSGLSQNTSGQSAFYGTTSENRFIRFLQYADSEDYMTLYINEYPNSTKDCEGNTIADDAFNEKRSFLLMVDQITQGSANLGNGTKANAWRLDFYDPITKKYIDIKRNHHYTFVINNIRSMPYEYHGTHTVSTAFSGDQEAWHNPASNIEYLVLVQETWASHNYSNGQYGLSLSTDTIFDASTSLMIKAQIPAGVDASKITTHVIRTYDRNGQPIGQPGDNLEISGCTNHTTGISFPANGTVTTLTFTVNDFTDLDSANMYIYLGNIYKRIFINLNPWVYMPDPGFRAYCWEKGFISEINPADNNYVKISSTGRAATTINLNRNGYYTIVNGNHLTYGGMNSCAIPNFSYIPTVLSTSNMSDVNTSLWASISDLTGIEAFTNLTHLYANGNNLAALDMSKNKKLERLDAESNPLTNVIFDNPNLTYIDLVNSELMSIDVTNCSNSLRVLMVTGYCTLSPGNGVTIGAGQGYGVRLLYTSVNAGGISVSGSSTICSGACPL